MDSTTYCNNSCTYYQCRKFNNCSKKCKNEINTLETNNKHEIDINALKQKHRLDMESKEKEHKLKIEEIKVQNQQEILKREKELSNSVMYSIMGDTTKDLFTGIFNFSEFKAEMNKKIKEGFNKKQFYIKIGD